MLNTECPDAFKSAQFSSLQIKLGTWRWREDTASPSPGEPLLAAGLLVTKLTQSAGQEHLELGAVSLVSTFLDQNDLPQQTSQRK